MSHESDSFIDEVSEEVHRDRLYATLRRYGWIAVVLVVVIVGGAAWNEYRKATAQAEAEAAGEAILSALDAPDPAARVRALEQIPAQNGLEDIVTLLAAAESLSATDAEAAAELLRPLAESATAPRIYSDMAALKMVLLGDAGLTPEDRTQVLNRLSQPGAPFRLLALEQQVLDLAAAGQTDAAIDAARALLEEPALTQGLLSRVSQLMVALGADSRDDAG